jgi:endonuclease-3
MASPADVAEIGERLAVALGRPAWTPGASVLTQLVRSVVGQRTSAENARRALARLRERFPDWGALLAASPGEVEAAIAPAGLAAQKASRLLDILQVIARRGPPLSLDFLRAAPAGEAQAWLEGLPGVGPTSAACVLLFGLGLPVVPVDMGIRRVAVRLGLAHAASSPRAIQATLEAPTPPEHAYALHVNLIQLSRAICTATDPSCPVCPLNDLCDHFAVRQPAHTTAPRSQAARRAAAQPITVARAAAPGSTR